MTRLSKLRASLLTAGMLAPLPAHAASLQSVSNWNGGVSGLPSDVTMYVYVPDKVVAKPPIVTLIHYCGGDAQAVFGQASGLAKAADQYGFMFVLPSSRRCWDIVSDKTRSRDGTGDSRAIIQMVRYALTKYNGNADRVYATGDSSGGMMTELLLALYPDVFKAGAAFAGMPAGCRGANESGSGGGYSNACAGGTVSHTPEEWGTIVRNMYPGYSGHRPRVQLFHGDADATIRYANHTEALKEWSNVLGLSATPTSTTSSGITLGSHQGKRESWKNTCGYTVLDGFTSIGGDHGPSDTLFNATYVVPFLGLDKTSALDPEIEQCGGGGGGAGAGGASASGGNSGTAGSGVGGRAGSGGTGNGGASSTSGGTSAGGASSAGSTNGGAAQLGGSTGQGGASANGGMSARGGATANGGAATTNGGATANGGAALGGAANPARGGAGTSGGDEGGSGDNGCSCSAAVGAAPSATGSIALLLGVAVARLRRRRR